MKKLPENSIFFLKIVFGEPPDITKNIKYDFKYMHFDLYNICYKTFLSVYFLKLFTLKKSHWCRSHKNSSNMIHLPLKFTFLEGDTQNPYFCITKVLTQRQISSAEELAKHKTQSSKRQSKRLIHWSSVISQIEGTQKLLNHDMGELISKMRLAQQNAITSLKEECKKQMLAAAHTLAMDSKNMLDAVDQARVRANLAKPAPP